MPQQRVSSKNNRKQSRRKIQMLGAGIGAALLAVVLIAAMTSGGDGDKETNQPVAPAAASSEEWTSETYAGGPRLAVDRTEVTYGDVGYGDPVEAVYRLKNIGDEPITIDEPSVKTLEGC